jgi:hypothetical protein
MAVEYRESTKYQPIKNAAGLHGADIGTIGSGTKIYVDVAKMHDGWVPITGPVDLGPTWKATGQQGWIEYANTILVGGSTHEYKLIVSSTDGHVISCTQVN